MCFCLICLTGDPTPAVKQNPGVRDKTEETGRGVGGTENIAVVSGLRYILIFWQYDLKQVRKVN